MKMVGLVREGILWKDFFSTIGGLGLTQKDAAQVLQVPERTLARRKAGRLDLQEGERFLRLVRLYNIALEVFGSSEKAWRWLRGPNRALGGVEPLSLLDTDLGTEAVEDVLGRIEHGVFS
jgi:putative toxin-antitoxin system antitoxin component (TIGR02293 family)